MHTAQGGAAAAHSTRSGSGPRRRGARREARLSASARLGQPWSPPAAARTPAQHLRILASAQHLRVRRLHAPRNCACACACALAPFKLSGADTAVSASHGRRFRSFPHAAALRPPSSDADDHLARSESAGRAGSVTPDRTSVATASELEAERRPERAESPARLAERAAALPGNKKAEAVQKEALDWLSARGPARGHGRRQRSGELRETEKCREVKDFIVLLHCFCILMVAKVLLRWQGHASAADSWEPADSEHLANCQERVAEYEAAASHRPKALRAHQRAGPAPLAQAAALPAPPPPPAAAPPHQPPPGCAVAAAGPPDIGSALLYWWPNEGWQLGRRSMSSATGRRPPPSRARSTRSSIRPPTALAGSR